MKYKNWLKEWLDNYIEPTVKARTFSRYSEIVNQHITPELGDYELSDLTPSVLQCYVTELFRTGNLKTGKGLAVNSVNAIVNITVESSTHP